MSKTYHLLLINPNNTHMYYAYSTHDHKQFLNNSFLIKHAIGSYNFELQVCVDNSPFVTPSLVLGPQYMHAKEYNNVAQFINHQCNK